MCDNPLNKEESTVLMQLILAEQRGASPEIPEEEMPFTCRIIQKRVEVLKLPVKLTTVGLLATTCFAKNPGQAVTLLIDYLTEFEGQELTVANLCKLYPLGFYTEAAFAKRVDTELKTRKAKWCHIY